MKYKIAICDDNLIDQEYVMHLIKMWAEVYNSTSGKRSKKKSRYLTSKDGGNHGFGLMRVDRIVEKYQGFINRQEEQGVFATEVMLPLVHTV